MSYLVLILMMNTNSVPTTVTLKLDVDKATCEEVFIPDARKQYVNTRLTMISAKCFSTK